MFVWESWITVKIRHQTEWNSFETKHEIPRRVASNIMTLSVTYPVCSFQSFVPAKLSFNSVFAAISLGNSYEHEALATTANIRRAWNIRCIIFSHPELHLNSNTWWLYLFGCAGQWIRHRQEHAHILVLLEAGETTETFLKASDWLARSGLNIGASWISPCGCYWNPPKVSLLWRSGGACVVKWSWELSWR